MTVQAVTDYLALLDQRDAAKAAKRAADVQLDALNAQLNVAAKTIDALVSPNKSVRAFTTADGRVVVVTLTPTGSQVQVLKTE